MGWKKKLSVKKKLGWEKIGGKKNRGNQKCPHKWNKNVRIKENKRNFYINWKNVRTNENKGNL